MNRAVRTARGGFGALAATLLAAASHALAGGSVTVFALAATGVLALPLCVALAGRAGSLWRLSVAVFVSQGLYHWSFAGIGAVQQRGSAPALAAHDHLGALSAFAPDLAEAASAGAWMWVAHGVAAMLTIALLHRGEHALLHLIRLVRSAVPVRVPRAVALPARPAILAPLPEPERTNAQVFLSAITHRGPPAPAFS